MTLRKGMSFSITLILGLVVVAIVILIVTGLLGIYGGDFFTFGANRTKDVLPGLTAVIKFERID